MEVIVNGNLIVLEKATTCYKNRYCIDSDYLAVDKELRGKIKDADCFAFQSGYIYGYLNDFYRVFREIDPECLPTLPPARAMDFILLLSQEQDVYPLLEQIRGLGCFRLGMVKYLEPLSKEQRAWINENFSLGRIERGAFIDWLNMKEDLTLAERVLLNDYANIYPSDLPELETAATSDEQRAWLKKYVY